MALEVGHGDKVVVVAKGPDAKQAVEKLSKLIADGLGDEGCTPAPAPATTTDREDRRASRRARAAPIRMCSSASLPRRDSRSATVFQVQREEIVVEEEGRGVEREQERLADAIDKARGQLEALRAQLHAKADPAKAAIFAAHAELLDDPDFLEIANSAIAKGKSAAFAWKSAAKLHAERLASLRNELLAQRANDVRDVGLARARTAHRRRRASRRRIPKARSSSPKISRHPTPPRWTAARVVGFATVRGGATSHVAILARSLEIPAIAGHRTARARSRQRHAGHPRWRAKVRCA